VASSLVVFQPEGRRTRIGPREDLLDAARRCGVAIEDLCTGRGTCAKCKVLVRRGADRLRPPTPHEALLGTEDLTRGMRLACQARPAHPGTVVLEIPPEAQRGWQRLQTSGLMPPFTLAPSIRVAPAPKSLAAESIRAAGFRIAREARPSLKRARGERASGVRLVVSGTTVLGLLGRADRALGMAFDLGSTKIAGFLLDLETGDLRTTVSAPNPQMVHGEDIMSRLAFAREGPENEDLLHREILEVVNRLLGEACARAKVRAEHVFAVTVVGNTAMHHLFLGLPTDGLSRAPYAPSSTGEESRRAGPFGLRANDAAGIVAPPVVAAFVGSDLISGVLATRMHRTRGLRVLIDVGTNTEICAGDRERLVACSTPSGPAFEGAHIRFGMRAADGAVERVAIEPETLHVDVRTIGRRKPRGLCGSALLDLLGELFLAGALDAKGRILAGGRDPRFRTIGGQPAFVVVPRERTSIGQDILLTQADVGQLQLAKAAIHAGIEILLDDLGAATKDVRTVYMAGAFGSYLAPESAKAVGMLPDLPLDRVAFVGNTAGSGARLALLSSRERAAMRSLARRIRHAPLAGDARFPRAFASALPLPHADPSRYPTVRPRGPRAAPPR